MGVHFYQNISLCVDVHLQHPSSIERAVKQHHQALVGYVWSSGRNISSMFHQLSFVIVTV